jgi:hypothetical protein
MLLRVASGLSFLYFLPPRRPRSIPRQEGEGRQGSRLRIFGAVEDWKADQGERQRGGDFEPRFDGVGGVQVSFDWLYTLSPSIGTQFPRMRSRSE